jgi:dihydrofolate reductase
MARKVIVAAFVSLDGVMQAPGGPDEDRSWGFAHGGWVWPHFEEGAGAYVETLFDGSRDLLLGRRTYDIFAGYWPNQEGPLAKAINSIAKHVAAHTPRPLEWNNSHAIGPDAVEAVRELKQQQGRDLFTQGSSDLIHSLLKAGLVDEFRVMTFPVLLGAGKRLFADTAAPIGLKLTDVQTTPAGVTLATYRADGEVRTGSFVD